MKQPLTILAVAVLAIILIYACGSTISTGNTSFVTITIGDTPHTAQLKAENATLWARFKYFLADAKMMPEAYAYIPSVVQTIVVTVTAADISTPIVGVASIAPTDTTASIRIEVPNGSARQFLVEGIRSLDGRTYYSGTATRDLNSTDLMMTIDMSFIGPGIWVSPTGNDTTGTGTQTNPYATISKALSTTTGTDAILVSAGTYTLTVGAGPATLQLRPGTALICLGTAFSSIIDASSTVDDLIYGNEGASVDNCKLIPGSDTTAIDDRNGGPTGVPSRIIVNGVFIDANGAVGGALDGIMLSADSTVVETTVQNTTWHGINILGGNPTIKSSTVVNNPTGISISGSASGLITGNSIDHNTTGVLINIGSLGDPRINGNSIYCNTFVGADVTSISAVRLESNAWNRDANTVPLGPRISGANCLNGDDICPRIGTPLPAYLPVSPAAPNGCPTP